jgi:cytochrome P450 family 714 subfamily C
LFLYSIGTIPVLHITRPDLVKAVSQYTSFELPEFIIKDRKPIFGENGIITVNGELWAYERKIIAQEFFMHKVKVITVNRHKL